MSFVRAVLSTSMVLIAALGPLAACSDSDSNNSDPCNGRCSGSMVCDKTSARCVQPACTNTCGANATCVGSGPCTCAAGYQDCNGDKSSASGDGCECTGSCNGATCGGTTCTVNCGPNTDCTGSTCSCKAGFNDCNSNLGQASSDGCECSGGCNGSQCASAASDGGGGGGDANKADAGGQPGGCHADCSSFDDYLCAKDPTRNNRCQECLNSSHCTSNPRARGPVCDTSDLAGTGTNFCICSSAADCATRTTGKLCKALAGTNPKLKQCTCDTGNDCPTSHPICEGTLFKRCRKRCTNADDCIKSGQKGTCDTKTGECSWSSFP